MEKLIKKYLSPDAKAEIFDNLVMFEVPAAEIMSICKDFYFEQLLQLQTLTAIDEGHGSFRLVYVFGIPGENIFLLPCLKLTSTTDFPSLANEIHELSSYERKINNLFGLIPSGYPNPKALTQNEDRPERLFPLRKDFNWDLRPNQTDNDHAFTIVEGEGIYEIPVGPVHAGIIEPGHFRFSVSGEEIVNLEANLGYTHKGTEKLFEILPLAKKVKLAERVSGDSSFSHSLAFCQAVERLAGLEIPEKAKWLRVIYAELERLANHLGDIGFIMLDTGYSFGGSNGQRLREMMMQWNEKLTGSRFLRGVNTVGGVTKDISLDRKAELTKELPKILADFNEVIEIARGSSSLLTRLQNTGILEQKIALDHGLVGVAGRACNINRDARIDFPYAVYDKISFSLATEDTNDVKARFNVRIKEVKSSIKILEQALHNLPESGSFCIDKPISLKKNSYAVGITEGWRGAIVYFVATSSQGEISRVDVRDPSFLNWQVLGYAGRGNVVPDFPLINKSFNLSYAGNDL